MSDLLMKLDCFNSDKFQSTFLVIAVASIVKIKRKIEANIEITERNPVKNTYAIQSQTDWCFECAN